MKQFTTIEKLDTAILYLLELASSLSVLLLAFGLIASMVNVLTKGAVLTDNLIMQRIWAWTQCIAIDASVAGAIIRTFRFYQEQETVKTWLYGFLSALLLFTAAIVSNIEAVQQTLNLTLDAAYVHVFIPVEVLIWVRSVAIVLLIVAHAMRHVHMTPQKEGPTERPQPVPQQPVPLEITPELIETLRSLLLQTTVTEDAQVQALPSPREETPTLDTEEEPVREGQDTQETGVQGEEQSTPYDRVKAYLAQFPNAKIREVADALGLPMSTANRHMKRVKEEAA
jgi:multisubunit Na+/H+ antiporter MnhE subunit